MLVLLVSVKLFSVDVVLMGYLTEEKGKCAEICFVGEIFLRCIYRISYVCCFTGSVHCSVFGFIYYYFFHDIVCIVLQFVVLLHGYLFEKFMILQLPVLNMLACNN